jgi:uncharacterized protein
MRMGAALAGAAAVLVWFLSPELAWPARAWLALLLAPLPALMIVQAQQLTGIDDLPRREAYLSSMASLWLLAALTAGVVRLSGMTPADIGLVGLPLHSFLLWTGVLTLAAVAILFVFRAAGFREGTLVRQLMPVTGREKGLFVALSVTAGVTEEVVFRGFVLYALLVATASLPLAVVLSSGVFGVVHAYQHPVGVLRAALLGALLAAPLIVEGSIYPAIAAHALIDVLSGLWLARYLLR